MSNDDLSKYAERLTRLLDTADEAKADIKELKLEVKSAGYDPAALAKVVQLQRDDDKRKKEEEKLQALTLYADRLGVQLKLEV